MTLFKRLKQKVHHHVDENGKLVKCYHDTKTAIASPGFWAGLTLGFPIEHALYDHVFPFTLIREWIGM